VHLATYDIDAIELFLIAVCFAAIIVVLMHHRSARAHEAYEDWHSVDAQAFGRLVGLPKKVSAMIEPPIQELIDNTGKGQSSPDVEDLEDIPRERYVEAKDALLGSMQVVMERDPFGREAPVEKYILDEDRFKAVKVEYKRLDAMLAKLRDARPELYSQIIPAAKAASAAVGSEDAGASAAVGSEEGALPVHSA
jgi:hypothetical protein